MVRFVEKVDVKNSVAVIPAYNEKGKIGITVKKTVPFVKKVVVVDDCSGDNTKEEAESAGAFVIRHAVNKGAGAAIRTGIDYAIKNRFDVVLVLGGDDQDNPDESVRHFAKIAKGYDFVQGSRYLDKGFTENLPMFRRITTKGYSLFFKIITGHRITDGTNGFRAFRTSIFKDKRIRMWQKWLNRYELEPYLYYMTLHLGYKVCEVPVTKRYPVGKKGYTKMVPLLDWWRITRPLIFLRLGIKK